MNITIRLPKVEYEMLKSLQEWDERYKNNFEVKIRADINDDYRALTLS